MLKNTVIFEQPLFKNLCNKTLKLKQFKQKFENNKKIFVYFVSAPGQTSYRPKTSNIAETSSNRNHRNDVTAGSDYKRSTNVAAQKSRHKYRRGEKIGGRESRSGRGEQRAGRIHTGEENDDGRGESRRGRVPEREKVERRRWGWACRRRVPQTGTVFRYN